MRILEIAEYIIDHYPESEFSNSYSYNNDFDYKKLFNDLILFFNFDLIGLGQLSLINKQNCIYRVIRRILMCINSADNGIQYTYLMKLLNRELKMDMKNNDFQEGLCAFVLFMLSNKGILEHNCGDIFCITELGKMYLEILLLNKDIDCF